jgi:hypothetical protein
VTSRNGRTGSPRSSAPRFPDEIKDTESISGGVEEEGLLLQLLDGL